jgi:3-deoxy-D-manno-octulosonic-acid transferase
VGEVRAALPIVQALCERRPAAQVVVSTTTVTGARTLAAAGFGALHRWAPFDAASIHRALFARLRPRVVVIMERELWPGLISACNRRRLPVLVANARLSEGSLAGYLRLPVGLRERLFSGVTVAAQSPADAARFIVLGVAAERVVVLGNTKLDAEPAAAGPVARRLDGWVAASTHEGEEAAAIAAHHQLLASGQASLLVLVPRHPERFAAVARLLEGSGLAYVRWSAGVRVNDCTTPVLLVDTLGALRGLYAEVAVAFVGGTLVPIGGHSVYEPLLAGTPVVIGPHHENVAAALEPAGDALSLVAGAPGLAAAIASRLADPESQLAAARAAASRLREGAGAARSTAELVLSL